MTESIVGKTTRSLKQRIREHKSGIRHNDVKYPHFNELSHNVSALHFWGIDTIDLPQGGKLCKRKLFWIHTLDALQPIGALMSL